MDKFDYISDLNKLKIEDSDASEEPWELQDYTISSPESKITVYFRELENHLIEHIYQAELVVGCVAWLTSDRILQALAGRFTAIVVQKEDFLRPDLDVQDNWKRDLRTNYDKLKCDLERRWFGAPLGLTNILDESPLDPIRCLGNYNRDKLPAFPRAHHKFVVFCRCLEVPGWKRHEYLKVEPYAVWTGSFNFTKNATQSLENALVITDQAIVNAYYKEWLQVEALSEPLDWSVDWAAPYWRIGT